MHLEHYPEPKLKQDIIQVLDRHIDLKKHRVFFFGSRVTQASDDRADIDIGIEGEKAIPWDALTRIKEELGQLPILYKIDIVDFKSVSEDFKKVALAQIETIA